VGSAARSGSLADASGMTSGTAAESVAMLLVIGLAASGNVAALDMQRSVACSDVTARKCVS